MESYQALPPGREQFDPVVSTGPSGLLLGRGPGGPVALRLFRKEPTRLYLAVPEYMRWLIAFRAVCIGAHLSVVSSDHRQWLALAETVRSCGGTIDLLRDLEDVPGQGRPFRPSLILDDDEAVGPTHRLGAWQAVARIGDPTSSGAVGELRNSEVAIVTPLDGKTGENLRRAYALPASQVKAASDLMETEVVLASARRLARVVIPPSPTEYRLLFG
ncbi:hypothetical protein [Tessaracoccus sp. OH4464_COT-324]|uniref:hypothetical protein n=1 Tax=Tessaracoccus sp. OH4464_COT-324 TaxID=2491059 RepID=UPI000F62DF12|nr:hypothetical protein [Tessaracoccus sp. OH4464_COT-324]RRD46195.1 hypothetical protein EII42_08385 [Tessaracoccus sp. OH4464_COT-324]